METLPRQEANEVIKSICADGDPLGKVICKYHDAMRCNLKSTCVSSGWGSSKDRTVLFGKIIC